MFEVKETKTSSSSFFKIKTGDNRIRILSGKTTFKSISGLKAFLKNEKEDGSKSHFKSILITDPSGEKILEPFSNEEIIGYGIDTSKNHMVVIVPIFDYDDNQVKQWDISQISIRESLRNIVDSWGDPENFDIKISRTGKDRDVKYTVVNLPPTPINGVMYEAIENARPNIDMEGARSTGCIFKKK